MLHGKLKILTSTQVEACLIIHAPLKHRVVNVERKVPPVALSLAHSPLPRWVPPHLPSVLFVKTMGMNVARHPRHHAPPRMEVWPMEFLARAAPPTAPPRLGYFAQHPLIPVGKRYMHHVPPQMEVLPMRFLAGVGPPTARRVRECFVNRTRAIRVLLVRMRCPTEMALQGILVLV